MALAYPGSNGGLCDIVARDHFLVALDDRQLELKLREREPADFDSSFHLAVRLEAYRINKMTRRKAIVRAETGGTVMNILRDECNRSKRPYRSNVYPTAISIWIALSMTYAARWIN